MQTSTNSWLCSCGKDIEDIYDICEYFIYLLSLWKGKWIWVLKLSAKLAEFRRQSFWGRGRNWLSGVTASCSSCCRNLLNCQRRMELFIKPTKSAIPTHKMRKPTKIPTPFEVAVAHFCHLPIGLAGPIFTSLLLRSKFRFRIVRGSSVEQSGAGRKFSASGWLGSWLKSHLD